MELEEKLHVQRRTEHERV